MQMGSQDFGNLGSHCHNGVEESEFLEIMEIVRPRIWRRFGSDNCNRSRSDIARTAVSCHARDLLQISEPDLRQFAAATISMISQEPALSLTPFMTVGTQIAEVLRAICH